MAKTLKLQLPDDLEQKLAVRAERLNVSLEELALHSLAQTVAATTMERLLQEANQLVVMELFERIRQAKQVGQGRVEVPAIDLTRKLVETMTQLRQVTRFSPSEAHPQTQLVLELPPASQDDYSQLVLEILPINQDAGAQINFTPNNQCTSQPE